MEKERENEIFDEELQKTVAFLRENAPSVSNRDHLRFILNNLGKQKAKSVHFGYEKFFAAIRFALPIGAIAVVALFVTKFEKNDPVIIPAPAGDIVATAPTEIKTPENVDAIVDTVYKTTVKEDATEKRVARVSEDKDLALRDKEVINNLATNYDDAF